MEDEVFGDARGYEDSRPVHVRYFEPRNKVLGIDVAGDVAAVGSSVKGFRVGDAVFGHIGKGGHAEYAVAKEDAALILKPPELTYPQAAALPFGALCALVFLRDFAKLKPDQRILIFGASGNVGVYATQIAKAFEAHVTAVSSGPNADLAYQLRADAFVDYKKVDLTSLTENFDIIFDTYGAVSFAQARNILSDAGLFLPLNFSLGEALANLAIGWMHKQRMVTAVNGDTREDMQELNLLFQQGKLRPVVDKVYRFDEIQNAYRHVEGRNRKGGIVIQIENY